MENQITNYRLERWIALFLALLFFVPFVAQAQEPAARVTFNGTESTLDWRCAETEIDGFRQCALMLGERVLTYRMAPAGQELQVRVNFAGDVDRDGRLDLLVDITRNGSEWQPAAFLSSAVAERVRASDAPQL